MTRKRIPVNQSNLPHGIRIVGRRHALDRLGPAADSARMIIESGCREWQDGDLASSVALMGTLSGVSFRVALGLGLNCMIIYCFNSRGFSMS